MYIPDNQMIHLRTLYILGPSNSSSKKWRFRKKIYLPTYWCTVPRDALIAVLIFWATCKGKVAYEYFLCYGWNFLNCRLLIIITPWSYSREIIGLQLTYFCLNVLRVKPTISTSLSNIYKNTLNTCLSCKVQTTMKCSINIKC